MTYHSIDQYSIQELEYTAGQRLEELLNEFNIELRRSKKYYVGSCPIHGGDKTNAFNIFHSGDIIGNWRCFTNNCHKVFQPTLTGFVRGILSSRSGWPGNNKMASFYDAVEWLKKFTGIKSLSQSSQDSHNIRVSSYINNAAYKSIPETTLRIHKSELDLTYPCTYYINRGFSPVILEKYKIGLCLKPNKHLRYRAVVPVFDDDCEFIIGCTARSIFDSCPLCGLYHNPTQICPENYLWQYSRWVHNRGFKAENYLYNLWNARPFIEQSKIAIIVESPGNVWKLEQLGIHNSIATFGAHLTQKQKYLLDNSGALVLLILMDPDNAGEQATKDIRNMCEKSYTIVSPHISNNDIADTSDKILNNKLIPIIKHIERNYI